MQMNLTYSIPAISYRFVKSMISLVSLISSFILQSNLTDCLQCLHFMPQFILPYRYDLLNQIPYVVDPSSFVQLLPAFLDNQGVEEGVFYTQEKEEVKRINLMDEETVEWYETEEILEEFQNHEFVKKNKNACCYVNEVLAARKIIPSQSGMFI